MFCSLGRSGQFNFSYLIFLTIWRPWTYSHLNLLFCRFTILVLWWFFRWRDLRPLFSLPVWWASFLCCLNPGQVLWPEPNTAALRAAELHMQQASLWSSRTVLLSMLATTILLNLTLESMHTLDIFLCHDIELHCLSSAESEFKISTYP